MIIRKHGAIQVSIWILWNVKCLQTPCRSILHIHIHICIHMDTMEYGVSPDSMQICTPYPYPYLYPYGYYGVWGVSRLHVDLYSISISISVSIWILWSMGCLQTPCRPTLCIHIHICIHMDITKCGVSPHSSQIDSLYRVHCQAMRSSNKKMHNQFAIDNKYLCNYPYIIKVIGNFAGDKFFLYNSMRRFCQNQISKLSWI